VGNIGLVHGLHPFNRFYHRPNPTSVAGLGAIWVFTKALIVLVGYILIKGGVQNFIQPKIMGQGLKISPVVIFVGLFFWGFLLGGIGAMMAVPLTLLVLTLMENFEATHMVAVLMRYNGEEKMEEKKEAARHVKRLWNNSKCAFSSTAEEDDTNPSDS